MRARRVQPEPPCCLRAVLYLTVTAWGTQDPVQCEVVFMRMDVPRISPTTLLTALALTDERGEARSPLRLSDSVPVSFGAREKLVSALTGSRERSDALAIGYCAGRAVTRAKALDVSSFLMDEELVVCGAEGESILELPWFEDDMFVARQLPDITEMPSDVRRLCIEHYRAALRGERSRFSFSSYGLSYHVDAIPTSDHDGRINAVLAIARPADRRPHVRARPPQ